MHLCISGSWRISVVVFLQMLMVSADRVFESSSLNLCQTDSAFTATLFNVKFMPEERSILLNVAAESSYAGNIILDIQAAAYGYTFLTTTVDPCAQNISALCPMRIIPIDINSQISNISSSTISQIPGIAYEVPDLDATFTVYMKNLTDQTTSLACVRAQLSNGKTVYQIGVCWATALIVGLGLITSAIVSGLGHSNAAAHLSLYTSSLLYYYQSVAIIGLSAVPLPAIVQSWTQNFSWSIGIINSNLLQRLARWYLIGTGGTPATILDTLDTHSIQVLKRDVYANAHSLHQRAQNAAPSSAEYTVTGITRVAFRAEIPSTNLFLTGITCYCILLIVTVLGVTLFKELCKLAIRANWVESYRFQNLRDNYRITLKGVIFRMLLIGYLPMMILSLWEFTQKDSAAEIFLAVVFSVGMTAALALATFNVLKIAKLSKEAHNTPAYLLFSDAAILNKWGFFYIQFRASACYYIVPTLVYILVKAFFVGLAQKSGVTQAFALVVIEAAALIAASTIRPWIDKPSNGMNIAICAINFFNAICLVMFTDIFNAPGLVNGILGVVFFLINVIFAVVLIAILLIAAIYSWIQKNPEMRYKLVNDNRSSFIHSRSVLNPELDELGFTARGERKTEYTGSDGTINDTLK